MDKEKIIKALELCNESDRFSCAECPYEGTELCSNKLHADAIALIKANEAPKPKYPRIYIFTKKGNLLPYFHAGETKIAQRSFSSAEAKERYINGLRKYYEQEREIQLIVRFRWDGSKCFCKINCPVNPLPVKGEFEAPCLEAVTRFLITNGWAFKQKLSANIFE